MAFQLRQRESVTDGLRRLAAKQLRSARAALRRTTPPTDRSIHEARKSIKKVRAILRLVEADDGRGVAGCEKRLRKVNRALSRLRDADAMVTIVDKLRSRTPRLLSEHTVARLRRRLTSEKRTAMLTATRDGVWKDVDSLLRTVRRAAKKWQPAHKQFRALAPGIRRTHRRGREALRRARQTRRAADFHEWRKQMKALWYQLRLIEHVDRSTARDVASLHRAETLLGDDHNLVVLCARLSKDASMCADAIERDRVQLAADRQQCELRTQALAAVRGVYRRRSKDFLRSLKRVWKTRQRHPVGGSGPDRGRNVAA